MRVFVEIGSGPVPTAAHSSRTYEGDDVYVSVELNEGDYYQENLFEVQRAGVAHRRDLGHIALSQGDGRQMLFPRHSVHEVYMGNVLTAVTRDEGQLFLQEAARIMDGSGPLVLDIGYTEYQDFIPELREDLVANGFDTGTVLREQDDDSEGWQNYRDAYPSVWIGDHVFLITHIHQA